MVTITSDLGANYRSNVWNLFYSMGRGYQVFLIEPVNGPMLWLMPPRDMGYAVLYLDAEAANPLLNEGLIEETAITDSPIARAIYELSDEGLKVFKELDAIMFTSGAHAFHSRIKI
jgi:hypothetical protein